MKTRPPPSFTVRFQIAALGPLQNNRRKDAGFLGAGIDADAIGAFLDIVGDGVTMHD